MTGLNALLSIAIATKTNLTIRERCLFLIVSIIPRKNSGVMKRFNAKIKIPNVIKTRLSNYEL